MKKLIKQLKEDVNDMQILLEKLETSPVKDSFRLDQLQMCYDNLSLHMDKLLRNY